MKRVKMQHETTISSSAENRIKYPSPCKIVNNVVIGDEGPLFKECVSLGELLFEKLNSNPDFVGLIDPVTEKQATFGEIKERGVRCALWLKSHGIQRGDIIGISTNNHPDCLTPLLGCLFICAHSYPMHYELNIHDSRYYLSMMKPKLVFVNADMVEIMAKAAEEENITIKFVTFGHAKGFQSFENIIQEHNAEEVDKFRCMQISSLEEIALFSFSSGSTSTPFKAILLSHRAFINNMFYDVVFSIGDEKIVMWISTMRWMASIILMIRAIYFYKTWIICDKFDEETICQLIEKYKVEFIWFNPGRIASIWKNGLLEKYHLPSLKRILMGGAMMRLDLQEALMKALPHTDIFFIYGMSELSGITAIQRKNDKIGSVGYVIKNVQMKIIDIDTRKTLGPNRIGEFLWKSPYIMIGFYNDPKATKKVIDEDGWLHSGDMGYYDENGEIYICDRIIETIRVDGLMVYPIEIENILQNHPAVCEVAVVAIHNDIVNERPFAFVSKVPGAEVTAEELMKLIANNLEEYKCLHGVQFLEKFPRTDAGKIARKQLKKMVNHFVSI